MDKTDILLRVLEQTIIFFGFGVLCAEVIGRLGFFRIQSTPLKIILLLILAVVMLTAVALLSETGVYPFSTSPRTGPGICTAAFVIWLFVRSRKKGGIPLLKKGYGQVSCVTCGYQATVKEYLSWRKNGKRGNRGKLPSGHIVIACPECDTEMRWDSLLGTVDAMTERSSVSARPKLTESSSPARETVNCPYCNGRVSVEEGYSGDVDCPHCEETMEVSAKINQEKEEKIRRDKRLSWWVLLLGVFFVIFVLKNCAPI